MRFANQLLPLLLASTYPARIISIYAAGKEKNLVTSDLSLRDPKHYTLSNVRSHAVIMKTFFMESLVEKHTGKLSFVHIFPGLVMTGGFDDKRLPLWFRWVFWMMTPLLSFATTPGKESGERVLFTATERFPAKLDTNDQSETKEVAVGTDGIKGSGAYAVGSDGEIMKLGKIYASLRSEGAREKIWEHTLNVFKEVEAGKKFTA